MRVEGAEPGDLLIVDILEIDACDQEDPARLLLAAARVHAARAGRPIDHAEKTRHEPDVVTSLPPRPAHRRTPVLPLTPTLRKLPRP